MLLVEAHPWADWPLLSARWEKLEAASPDPSFFLTASWVGTWLQVFGPSTGARILAFHDPAADRELVGICLVAFRNERRGPFRIRQAHLNTSGEAESDEACAEYNRLLCRPGLERPVATAFAKHMESERWDELVATRMAPGPGVEMLVRSPLGRLVVARRGVPSHFVDLRRFDDSPDAYLKGLSRNTREQIRRSRRLLESSGPLRIREAGDLAEAGQILNELATLHTLSWKARGKPGVFASPAFRDFHERLLRTAFSEGRIQLLRLDVGGTPLAMLYNFVHGGKAYFYQSGLRATPDGRIKTGFVAHACAIDHCKRRGLLEYDFLSGDEQYKRSLANDSRELSSLVFRKTSLKLRIFGLLRRVRRTVRARSIRI